MTRQIDPEHRHRQAPPDLHIQHGQRDGDAGAPFEHLIQATVAWVEEILLVAMEAQLSEQIALRGLDEVSAIVEVAQPVSEARSEFIQLVQKRLRRQIRELDGSQVQGRAVQAAPRRIVLEQLAQGVHVGLTC